MAELCDKHLCTGCLACVQICPKHTIDLIPDAEGFIYPSINNSCINCGLCEKICPILNPRTTGICKNQECYAAWSKDLHIRTTSSSGGVFGVLATYVLTKLGGVVFGAAYDKNNKVSHIGIDSIESLSALQGSKYVQSDINTVFIQVRTHLQEKRYVLFAGTPCQIAGLSAFLKFESPYLFTVDLICHGVASPKLFQSYLQYLQQRFNEIQLANFTFRLPDGWRLQTSFTTSQNRCKVIIGEDNFYIRAYINGYLHRKSCYECLYANMKRQGDLTLGDFWGINKSPVETRQGVSLILLNSEKGRHLFKEVQEQLISERRTLEEAAKGNPNLVYPQTPPPERNSFYSDYFSMSHGAFLSKYHFKNPAFWNLQRAYNLIQRKFRQIIHK